MILFPPVSRGGLADERFGHTTPKQNLESHCVSSCPWRCPSTPAQTLGLAWDAPLGPFLALSGCSRQSTPRHMFISALLCPLPSRGTQGAESKAVPQLPSSVQALSTRLTLCCLLWSPAVGLQGPNHPGSPDGFPALGECGWATLSTAGRTEQGLLEWELGVLASGSREPQGSLGVGKLGSSG